LIVQLFNTHIGVTHALVASHRRHDVTYLHQRSNKNWT